MPSTPVHNPFRIPQGQRRHRLPWVLYVRKSSEADERQAQSLRSQEDAGRDLARQLGVEVLAVNDAHSAKEPGRPVFDRVLAMVDRQEVGGIIAWHPDRLSRNEIDAAAITYRLRKGVLRGLCFVSYQFVNGNEGILMLQNALSQSQYFSAKLATDVVRGMASKRSMGWYPHRVRPGYVNNSHETKGLKTIGIDPDRFPIIRRAFDYFLTGAYTERQLLTLINDQWGYRSRPTRKLGSRPMGKTTLSDLLTDIFYTGNFRWNGEVYAGKHPPMITMDEHHRVLALLGRLERIQPRRHDFAYAGTLYCHACTGLFVGYQVTKRTGRSYVYYRCQRCLGETISEAELQRQLEDISASISLPAADFHIWAQHAVDRHFGDDSMKEEAVAAQRAQSLAAIDNRLRKLREALTTDLISPEEFRADREELLSRREQLVLSAEAAGDRRARIMKTVENVLGFAASAREMLGHQDAAVRRACARAMGSNYRIRNHTVLVELHPLVEPLAEATAVPPVKTAGVELAGTGDRSTKKQAQEPANPSWSRTLDLVLTIAEEQGLSFPDVREQIQRSGAQPSDPGG